MKSLIALPAALTFAPLLLALPQPAGAKTASKAEPELPANLPDIVNVDINTELGTITVALDVKHAPVTARNFLNYTVKGRLDGITFYRVMRLPWGDPPNGLIQMGLSGDPAKVLPPIAHEPTSQTGLSHTAGAISIARFAPGTATADFTIMMSDMTGLDANPKATDAESQAGYAVFGRVVSGMDVARTIYDAPLSSTKGEGVMKGQMIENPVKVITVRQSAEQPEPAAQTAPVDVAAPASPAG